MARRRGLVQRSVMTFAAALVAALPASAEPRAITFRDLPDPSAQAFVDPFMEMGLEMLQELRTVVRLEARLEAGDVSVEARPRLEARIEEARDLLVRQGYDIEDLLSRRWTVAENRRRARVATNPELSGAEVALSGFLIPAGMDANGERIGYLVAEIGMCSHIPPPPPNELVQITLPDGLPTASLYQPVRVAGTLRPAIDDRTIFLLDGQVRMVSMWNLVTREAPMPLAAGDPAMLSAVPHGDTLSMESAVERPDE